jgi:hypothetical protein
LIRPDHLYGRIQNENLTFPVAVDDLVLEIAFGANWTSEDAVFDISTHVDRCSREHD